MSAKEGALESVDQETVDPARKRQVKNYLINRRFQLKWISLILLLTVALFATLGGYIWQHEKHASDAVLTGLSAMYDAEEVAVMKELFVSSDSGVLWALLGSGALLIGLLAGVGVVLTHKIAGPVHALSKSMKRVRRGHWANARGVREGDEFQELADAWLETVDSLCTKEREEIEHLGAVLAMEIGEDAKVAISRLVDRKKGYIG